MERKCIYHKKRTVLFIFFSFFFGWVLFLSIPILGLKYEYEAGMTTSIVAIAMFSPTIGNILTRALTKEGFKDMYLKPNFKGNSKLYLLVYLGPSILLILGGLLYFTIFPGKFDSGLTQINAAMFEGGTLNTLANKQLLSLIWSVILFGPILNIIPSLGEELGWRGYLLPKLRGFLSDRWALVLSGAIWGVWHLPIIVMGHNYGLDYPGYPWLGIIGMIIFCIVLGIIEGYATIKLDSIIPAAMIHSAINVGAVFPFLFILGDYNRLIGPSIFGLIGGIPFIILAIALLATQ